ncbi:MAG: pectin acetylesterase-family hydrolase [Myxococcota bacterium]
MTRLTKIACATLILAACGDSQEADNASEVPGETSSGGSTTMTTSGCETACTNDPQGGSDTGNTSTPMPSTGQSGSTGDTGGSTGTETGGSMPATPLIGDALSCAGPQEPNPGPGDALKKIVLQDPEALCNDGTPAVIFVREAAAPEFEDDWVIFMQGGGNCQDAEGCAERWCTLGHRMTSSLAPDAIWGIGVLDRDVANPLGAYNQVFIQYCSSDNYIGRADDTVFASGREFPEYRVHFKGNAITNAVADLLETGAASDDGTEVLPPLQGAGEVVLAGGSAGCAGVAFQADRLTSRFSATGKNMRLICDGNFPPNEVDLGLESLPPDAISRLEEEYLARVMNHDALFDETCVAGEAEEPWRCATPRQVLGQYIEGAPLFLRMDLRDSAALSQYLAFGLNPQEFSDAVRNGLGSAFLGGGNPGTPISVYGPNCQSHVALNSNPGYFDWQLDVGDGPQTFADLVGRWIDGETIVAIDPGTNSSGPGCQ